MKASHLLSVVIIPTLQYLEMDSTVARYLLLGTAAQESQMGNYLVQSGSGPALGIYQMEPATHQDIWNNYLQYRSKLVEKINGLLCSGFPKKEQLAANLFYATAMTRIHYLRVSEPLPELSVIQLAHYWKKYYNTNKGKGKASDFERCFKRLIGEPDDQYSCRSAPNGSGLVRGKTAVTESQS